MIFIAVLCLLLPLNTLQQSINAQVHDRDVVNFSEEFHARTRRAASFDFFGHIKNSITSTIGKASASVAGAASGSSSSKTISVEKPTVVIEKDIGFDGWALKKSILNTLFQAVKAITGGITAINGQIIKSSGHVLSHGGKLIAASGDAVTDVGRKIALSAKLLPPEKPKFFKYFGSSSHSGHSLEEEFTSFDHEHDGIGDYLKPHDLPVYRPEPPLDYVPIALALDNGYHNSHINHDHYGPPPIGHTQITNYIERKAQDHSYDKVDSTPLTEPDSLDTTSQHKAVEALQQLLRKLPNKLIAKDNLNDVNSVDNHDHDKTLVKQYHIPNDPVTIPEFKPIKPAITSTYTFKLGPIETVTKHTIGGNSNANSGGGGGSGGDQTKYTFIQNPVPNYTVHTNIRPQSQSHLSQQYSHSSRHNQAVNRPPLDLYHTMTLKNNNHNTHNHNNNNNSNKQKQSSVFYLPANQPYEIQKSIEYQLHRH